MSVLVPSAGDFTIGGQFIDWTTFEAGPSGDHHSLLNRQDVDDVGAMPTSPAERIAGIADIFSEAIAMPVLQPCSCSDQPCSAADCIANQDWGCAGADISEENHNWGAAAQIAKKTGWCVPQ